jgi:hypothetical protein
MTSLSLSRIASIIGFLLAASLLTETPALSAPAATDGRPASAASRDAWRAALLKIRQPKKGCFTASYPSLTWHEVPCVTAPLRPYPPVPFNVGHGNDFSAKVPGTITAATGSFDAVNGVTSETGFSNVADSFSLQVNSSFFTTTACAGAAIPANCQGWQQFVYSNDGFALMQYWLIHWGAACPPGWTLSPPSCYMNSTSVAVPPQPIANLAQLSLSGQIAGGTDTIVMSTGANIFTASGNDTILNLAQGWNYAEFNIFGDGGSSTAAFNPGANLIVRTAVTDGTMNAPNCQGDGLTAETNNLNLVQPCCPYGGAAPAIVFDESNNPGATSICASGTSIGDTHLTNFAGLLFDFQASGDFLLAETGSGFAVQTRQASGAPMWPNAAVNKAVAVRLGASRLAVCLGPTRLIVDGRTTDIGEGKSLALPGGDGVTRNANVYLFTRQNGESVSAEVNGGWINVVVNLGHVPVAKVRGLLGNANGNTGENDLAARDGTVLPQPVSFNDLYRRYGESWRIPAAESLPAQLCGDKDVERGNPRAPFRTADLDPKVAERARAVCIETGVRDAAHLEACTLDVAVLGDRAVIAFGRLRAQPPRAVLRTER